MGDLNDTLLTELELALAYTPPIFREPMRTFFELDQRLARIVSSTSEPMLGQMRLAWWRDMLKTPISQRPTGDAVLDKVGDHWADYEKYLGEMIDAWEVLIVAERLGPSELEAFSRGRGCPFQRFLGQSTEEERRNAEFASQRWSLADAVVRLSDEDERKAAFELATKIPVEGKPIGRNLRGLAVLNALAIRALKNGGIPLMQGRGASIVALKAGLLGR